MIEKIIAYPYLFTILLFVLVPATTLYHGFVGETCSGYYTLYTSAFNIFCEGNWLDNYFGLIIIVALLEKTIKDKKIPNRATIFYSIIVSSFVITDLTVFLDHKLTAGTSIIAMCSALVILFIYQKKKVGVGWNSNSAIFWIAYLDVLALIFYDFAHLTNQPPVHSLGAAAFVVLSFGWLNYMKPFMKRLLGKIAKTGLRKIS